MSPRSAVAPAVLVLVALVGACTPGQETRGPQDPVVQGEKDPGDGKPVGEPTAELGATLVYDDGLEITVARPEPVDVGGTRAARFAVTLRNETGDVLDLGGLSFYLLAGSDTPEQVVSPSAGVPEPPDGELPDGDVARFVVGFTTSATDDLVLQVDLGLERLSPAVFTS